MNARTDDRPWRDVLDFWFPEGRSPAVDAATHRDHWFWRMQGGADAEIIARFSGLTERAAAGSLDHWAGEAPRGRQSGLRGGRLINQRHGGLLLGPA